MKAVLLSLLLALAPAARAADGDAVAVARAALAQLEAAGQGLAEARGAQDRVTALTRVIRAYEAGLAALREGLRQAAIREAALVRGLEAESAQVSRLLGALESLETTPETLLLAHPMGPVGSVRSGMLLASVSAELQRRVDDLRSRIEAVRVIRAVQESAHDSLDQGLRDVQQARTELSAAISNRTDLPRRFADDGAALARLAQDADTLASFAEGLAGIAALADAPRPPSSAGPRPLPVDGQVIHGFDQPDAAGIRRPGWLVAAAPVSLVTAPSAATIRYLGPLLDYGKVMILEPDPDTLLVLAGLAEVYGAVGEVIPAGTPVGLLGGQAQRSEEFVAESRGSGGASRRETLYLEVRQGSRPVDPATWFAGTEDDNR